MARGGPTEDSVVGELDGVASFGADGAAEGTMLGSGNANGVDGSGPHQFGSIAIFVVAEGDATLGVAPFDEVSVVEIECVIVGLGTEAVDVGPPVGEIEGGVGLGETKGVRAGEEEDVGNSPTGEEEEARVGGLDVGHDLLEGDAVIVEAIAPGESGVGFGPADSHDELVGTLANPIKDVGGGNGGIDGRGHVGVEGRNGGGEVEHAGGAHLDDVAVGYRLVAIGVLCPLAIEIVAPVVDGRGEEIAVDGVFDVADEASAVLIGEVGVVGGDGVDEVDGHGVAVPTDSPGVGHSGGAVVPSDEDEGLVGTGAAPELNVAGGEGDVFACAVAKGSAVEFVVVLSMNSEK